MARRFVSLGKTIVFLGIDPREDATDHFHRFWDTKKLVWVLRLEEN